MRPFGRAFASLCLAVLLPAGAAAAAELETFEYGRWSGTATTDEAGAFSRCAVSARFKRASAITGRDVAAAITIDRDHGWTLGFAGAAAGDRASFRLLVDDRTLFEAKPEISSDEIAVIAVADPAGLMTGLRAGHTLTVSTADDQMDLTLAGIGRALDWVEGCSRRYESFVSPGREKATAEAAVLRSDIAALMRRLLETVDVKDFRVGPPPGIPAFPSEDKSVSWQAEGLQGEVQVWAGRSPKALAERIISTSSGCKRRSDARKGAAAKADPVVYALVDCVDAAGARQVALLLMPRTKGGIYLISVQARNAARPDAVEHLGARLATAARKGALR